MTEQQTVTEEIKDENISGSKEIRVGQKTIFAIFVIITLILCFLGIRIHNKLSYKTIALTDKKYYKDVAEFSYPAKWVPLGKVFYNPQSIPNLLTFFVATVNPKEIVECQFFSPQMETDNGREFFSTTKLAKFAPEKYLENAILKMSPTAKNIKLVKKITPGKKELKQAYLDKNLFNSIYTETNPGTTKGCSELNGLTFLPVHYLYEYNEDGKDIMHLMEGRIVFFNQTFSKSVDENAPINVAIKYIKCENIFSYKAEKTLYRKNIGIYKHFKKSLKTNEEWEKLAVAERQQILQKLPTITTMSLGGGDKFDIDAFKNTVYKIEYPDETTITMSRYFYGKDLKSFFTKWF